MINQVTRMVMQMQRQFPIHRQFSNEKSLDTMAEEINNSELIDREIERRRKQLETRHRELQKHFDDKINIPHKICGMSHQLEKKFSYLPERVMQYYKVQPNTISDYLLKIYKASLYAMADRNESFMREYWQEGLIDKALKNLNQAEHNGYKLKVIEDQNFMKAAKEKCEVLDSIMLRGLSIDREKNLHPDQYHKFIQASEVGLCTYTPNYLTNNNEKFIDPQQNKHVYQGYDNLVLRMLVRIKTPLKLRVEGLVVPEEINTNEHLCVMENQMVPPKHLESSYKYETLIEWLAKYQFGIWKVTDMDNYMCGNSPFRKHQEKQKELDEIFKGTVFDKAVNIDIRRF